MPLPRMPASNGVSTMIRRSCKFIVKPEAATVTMKSSEEWTYMGPDFPNRGVTTLRRHRGVATKLLRRIARYFVVCAINSIPVSTLRT